MGDSQQPQDSEEIPPKEWKKIIDNPLKELALFDIDQFKNQFLDHPKIQDFINWTGEGYNMLGVSVALWRTDIAKLLLEHGADVNIPNKNGWTPLFSAIEHDDIDTMKLFLEKGAKVNNVRTDGFQRTPLILAAMNGHTEIVQLLLEEEADTTCVDFFELTALMHADREGHAEIVKFLKEKEEEHSGLEEVK